MSKSERLFELLTLLRAKRYAVTAKELAERMEVSERTIYRDILVFLFKVKQVSATCCKRALICRL